MGTTTLRAFSGLGQPPLRGKTADIHTLPSASSNTRQEPGPLDHTAALEKLTHVSNRVCSLWSQREFETYVMGLIWDARDGKRQGLPWDAAQDLLFLLELSIAKRALHASEVTGEPFSAMYDRCLTAVRNGSGKTDNWSDPDVQREVGHCGRDRPRAKPAPTPARRAKEKKGWLRRLFG